MDLLRKGRWRGRFVGVGGESRLHTKYLTAYKQISPFECQGPNCHICSSFVLFIQIKIRPSKHRKAGFITNKSMTLSFPNIHQHDSSIAFLAGSIHLSDRAGKAKDISDFL